MPFKSTKTYGHEAGLSCCFRQWRAQSHCRFLHGYAIAVHLEFEADELDVRNWVVDFGSLKSFKGTLEGLLDHKTLVAEDDPELPTFIDLNSKGLIQLRIVPSTGCEALAKLIYDAAVIWLEDNGYAPRVRLNYVRVAEHAGNGAIYSEDHLPVQEKAKADEAVVRARMQAYGADELTIQRVLGDAGYYSEKA